MDDLQKRLDQKAEKQEVERLSDGIDRLSLAVSDKASKGDLLELQKEVSVLKANRKCMEVEVQQAVEKEMNDWKEREKRRANIMIYGVDEKDEETAVSDKEKVVNFLEGQLEIKDFKIIKLFRVGKKSSVTPIEGTEVQGATAISRNNRPRPIKVTFSSASEKNKLMTKYKEKKDKKDKLDFGVSSDFTKSETQKYQSLKTELKRKEEAGEKGWYIRKLKLVQKK